jgi:hypothetical protein
VTRRGLPTKTSATFSLLMPPVVARRLLPASPSTG